MRVGKGMEALGIDSDRGFRWDVEGEAAGVERLWNELLSRLIRGRRVV